MYSRACKCSEDRCNSKVHVIPGAFETSVTTSTSRPLMVSMHNPLWDQEHRLQTSSDFQSVLLPFIVLLIGVLLVLLVIIAVTRIYRYRRRVQSYTYAQLTADLTMGEA